MAEYKFNVFYDGFDYTIGDAWNVEGAWPAGLQPAGAKAFQASAGVGRLQSAPIGNYSAASRVSRRANTATTQDFETYGKFRYPTAAETQWRLYGRTSAAGDGTDGYFMEVSRSGTFRLGAGSGTILGTFDLGQPVGTNVWWWAKMRVSGTRIQAKAWPDSQPEPAAWTADLTDVRYPAAGYFALTCQSGQAAAAGLVDFGAWFVDALTTVPSAPPTVDVGGSATSMAGVRFGRTAVVSGSAATVRWSLTSRPQDSRAALSSSTSTTVTLTPDIVGAYVLTCTVTDSYAQTASQSFTLTAVAPSSARGGRSIMGQDRRLNLARHRVFSSGVWSQ